MLNPSTADNMSISILEALASGVPVVSTDAGGIPDLVVHEQTALLMSPRGASAMAGQALRLLHDGVLRDRLCVNGLAEASRYAWPRVGAQWLVAFNRVARPSCAGPDANRPIVGRRQTR